MKTSKHKTPQTSNEKTENQEVQTVDYKSLYEAEAEKTAKILTEKNEWQKLANTYLEKYAQALKGFLIMQGASEQQAEAERLKLITKATIG